MPLTGNPPRLPVPTRDAVTDTEIAALDPRRQHVLRKRREGAYLLTVGNELGCSREWVRQLERTGLATIREQRERERGLRE